MHTPKHIAIYISAEENVSRLIELISLGKGFSFSTGLAAKKGVLFSTMAIRQLVNEELLHDRFEVEAINHHSLFTSSSGEQRIALLHYLLSKHPDYIIADNVFDSLDTAHQENIINTLGDIATHTLIIQILYRKNDCLPFIDTVLTIKNETIIKEESGNDFIQTALATHVFTGTIPPPISSYSLQEEPLVKMDNVCVQYGETPILKNICWQIRQNEFWQLTGPNGSGKSTLLGMIIGDNVKGYGQNLFLFGKRKGSGEAVWDIKKNIGYFTSSITEEYPRLDSIENMIISGFFDSIGLYIQPTNRQIQIADDWLNLLGLQSQKNKPFRFFTLAQQRMVLIARAMVKHPPLLILDEPTAGLDDDNALLFTTLINKIAAETNTIIIYVSHRKEPGLFPDKIFELTPSSQGSTGVVRK